MTRDAIRKDAPAAVEELALLRSMKVGDIRRGLLFPALDMTVEWVCKLVTKDHWEFDGLFLGQPLCRAEIRLQAELLTFDLKEV